MSWKNILKTDNLYLDIMRDVEETGDNMFITHIKGAIEDDRTAPSSGSNSTNSRILRLLDINSSRLYDKYKERLWGK